jgi:glycerol-3-phosphate dehydrogenase
MATDQIYDLVVIGGGINGVGIARDAAGRGLSVLLCEKDDLASATSSASSKLIHGGLRYLEYYEFRLVSEALKEREILLRNAPHIIKPLRFVMPYTPELRPKWMIRAGLFLYDLLGKRKYLPPSSSLDLKNSKYGKCLRSDLTDGFIYSDCWVDDARLVVLNAVDAAQRGATIMTRTACIAAVRENNLWQITLQKSNQEKLAIKARALVNAGGPWVKKILTDIIKEDSNENVRLVKGSHIIVRKMYEGDHAYILQNDDKRVVFIIPFEENYAAIGTTDIALDVSPDSKPKISPEEITYLCKAVNRYLAQPINETDIVWSYSGVRPLYDDGKSNPSAVTRDYVLTVHDVAGEAPILSVFGGKITTYRRLAEQALKKLAPYFSNLKPEWTADSSLPGGDIPNHDFTEFLNILKQRYLTISSDYIYRLARHYGSLIHKVLGEPEEKEILREIKYLIDNEWALTSEDVLWRRTKYGLNMSEQQKQEITSYIERHRK